MEYAVKVNNLSKKYKIGHKQKYYALRDSIAALLANPLGSSGSEKDKPFLALKDVSFEVSPGEVVGIIGSNGAGKSTLLKIIGRITLPTEGEIRINGRIGSLLEVGTGFHPELTGRENIFLNGAILGMKQAEIKKHFAEIVEFAGIENFLDTPVKHYSSGMHVRLAFSVAAHLETEILLVDEVLAVGDAEFQKKSLGKMEQVTGKEGRTVLFVSHNMTAIQNLCTRCLWLEDGAVKDFGETKKIVEEYIKTINSATSISINIRKDREGNGKVRIKNVYLKDSNGKDTAFFRSGQDAQIWLEYAVLDKNVKSIDAALAIDYLASQNRLAFVNSKVIGTKIPITTDRMIKILIPKLPFNVGSYPFNIHISNDGVVFDWIKNAGFFRVETGGYYKEGNDLGQVFGPVLIPFRFL